MSLGDSRFKTPPPAAPQANPYAPNSIEPLVMEMFMGINTSTTRPGVDDKQCWWIDGFIPLGPRDLRTMYGIGPRLWLAPVSSIVFFSFANIGATPIMVAILANGAMYQVNTSTGAQTLMAPAGTITNPSRLNVGLSQYGSQYVLIVAKQTHGYFIWDGTTLFSAGGLGPAVTLTAVGSGYTSVPTVAASGGSGSGATFLAAISGGAVTGVKITNPGTGYLPTDTVTLAFSGGGGSGATATVTIMPSGISGTAIETYAGRVWIANGATLTFSAPGSVSNFATASGGGNITSSDSFLRVRYVQLLQTNGFLYLIADSSINYISGVQTTGSPPTTTFTNQNADPEVGTPWPSTVGTFGRNILFANAFGAHISYGAAVTKISEALDGVYNTVPNFAGIIPSAAKAIIFGKKVWILLLPIVDPVSGQQTNKLCLWGGPDKKIWWTSNQDAVLTYIQSQEIDSVLTAYGTDGTSVYPLFQQPSSGFQKTVQSKLWDKPGGYQFMKATNRLWGLFQYYSAVTPNLEILIDNEMNSQDYIIPLSPNAVTWFNNSESVVSWVNNSSAPVTWVGSGNSYTVLGPYAVGQQGVLTGFTVKTFAQDMAIVSMMIHDTLVGYRG